MSNLIITIISIGLVAVAAIMGIYYGGVAYEQGQINAIANSIMNESQQILAAERVWALNHNQPDISGMGGPSAPGGLLYIASNNGTGMSGLINNHELTSWLPLGGTLAPPSPSSGNPAMDPDDLGCYNFSGHHGQISREFLAYMGGNYVAYVFALDLANGSCLTDGLNQWSSSTTDVSQAKNPIVLVAKAINNSLDRIPGNADMSKMNFIGLPQVPTGSTLVAVNYFRIDPNNVVQANYCYVAALNIICVFGPS